MSMRQWRAGKGEAPSYCQACGTRMSRKRLRARLRRCPKCRVRYDDLEDCERRLALLRAKIDRDDAKRAARLRAAADDLSKTLLDKWDREIFEDMNRATAFSPAPPKPWRPLPPLD